MRVGAPDPFPAFFPRLTFALDRVFDLTKRNMEAITEDWSDEEKKVELKEDDARFLVVIDQAGPRAPHIQLFYRIAGGHSLTRVVCRGAVPGDQETGRIHSLPLCL